MTKTELTKLLKDAKKLLTDMYRKDGTHYEGTLSLAPIGTIGGIKNPQRETRCWVMQESSFKTRCHVGAISLGIRRHAEAKLRRLLVSELLKQLESNGVKITLDFALSASWLAGVGIRREDVGCYFTHSFESGVHPLLDGEEIIESDERDYIKCFADDIKSMLKESYEYIDKQHSEAWLKVKPLIDIAIDQHFGIDKDKR